MTAASLRTKVTVTMHELENAATFNRARAAAMAPADHTYDPTARAVREGMAAAYAQAAEWLRRDLGLPNLEHKP